MSDRLVELRRQRELLQQHLAWLDREIASEQAKDKPAATAAKLAAAVAAAAPRTSPPPATPRAAGGASPAAASPSIASAVATRGSTDADRILQEYRVSPGALHSNVRKGCLLYFAAALALFFAVVAILYLALRQR